MAGHGHSHYPGSDLVACRPGGIGGAADGRWATTGTRRFVRPGGRQILCEDPSGNVIELFQPA